MSDYALIIDDDRTERRFIENLVQQDFQLETHHAENGKTALLTLEKPNSPAVIFLDLNMPVMDGWETLDKIMGDFPNIPVIIITGNKDLDDAVQLMKNGAFDFVTKPMDKQRLKISIRNALKLNLMSQEISRLKRQGKNIFTFNDLIGHDTGLKDSVAIGKKAVQNTLPVLIMGETGTGKEMFARAIHGESERVERPFIAVNCGAIPEKLIESTLFGHEKGAFTGAIQKALGKFQEASGGTLFLDEIGELPLEAQVKLLRALQEQEVEPVGASKSVKVDVRIISATNRDLKREVIEGRFREDLYFRLNVLNIELPPLRNRTGDIKPIAEKLMQEFCTRQGALLKNFTPAALEKLKSYSWPGNVRELENAINRTMALCEQDEIGPDEIILSGDQFMKSESEESKNIINILEPGGTLKTFKMMEEEIINKAIDLNAGNISKTARRLNLAKSTIYAKLNREDDAA